MNLKYRAGAFPLALLVVFLSHARAQGSLEDYQRAQQFLPGNLRHVAYIADVGPHWIENSSRFWYRKSSPGGSEFILVDAENNTRAPAFDHARLAQSLSRAAKRQYSATDLPFFDFEFVDQGKAIRFDADGQQWTCSLDSYDCRSKPPAPGHPNENISPNQRWAAFVKEHNLFLRDTSTGTELELTHDGV